MTNNNMIEERKIIDMSTVDMDKVEMWSDPVICFLAIECSNESGKRYIRITPFADFVPMHDGDGEYYLRNDETLINAFPAPTGTKKWYGDCDGCVDEELYVGCEIPGKTTTDFKEALVRARKLNNVDIYTGKKVV